MLFRAAMILGVTTKKGAFVIADVGDSQGSGARVARLQSTLDFIRTHAPLCLAQWERYFDRILIVPGNAPMGTYYREIRTCGISAQHLMRDTPVSVAMTLAHEAAHARINRLGVSYRDEKRDRIEILCTEAEVALATRLPNAEHELAMARIALTTKPWQRIDWHDRGNHISSILGGERD